jgi:hypothetical protein
VLESLSYSSRLQGLHGAKIFFKFENMWLKYEGFVDRVRFWCSSYHFQSSPSYILSHKLKALKADLRAWNKEFGNIGRKRLVMLEELRVLEVWRKREVYIRRR